jgi:hypothetical protein
LQQIAPVYYTPCFHKNPFSVPPHADHDTG